MSNETTGDPNVWEGGDLVSFFCVDGEELHGEVTGVSEDGYLTILTDHDGVYTVPGKKCGYGWC